MIAELLRKGIDKDRIYQHACNTNPLSRLRLNSYAVYNKMQVFEPHGAGADHPDQR